MKKKTSKKVPSMTKQIAAAKTVAHRAGALVQTKDKHLAVAVALVEKLTHERDALMVAAAARVAEYEALTAEAQRLADVAAADAKPLVD
jgi:hypothetical protein